VTNRDGVQTARTGLSKFGKVMVNFYLGRLGVAQSEIGFPFLSHDVPYVRACLALAEPGAFGGPAAVCLPKISVDAASRVLVARPGRRQLGEQGVHRRTLVGKGPYVAVPAAERERLGERPEGAGVIAAGGLCQRPQ
jgi:hypothetical protein